MVTTHYVTYSYFGPMSDPPPYTRVAARAHVRDSPRYYTRSVIDPTPMATAHGVVPTVYITSWSQVDGTPD